MLQEDYVKQLTLKVQTYIGHGNETNDSDDMYYSIVINTIKMKH